MRICVIGNSHVGCIKAAWDNLRTDHNRYELTFFAAIDDTLSDLDLIGGKLIPKTPKLATSIAYTSGGLIEIDIGNFDAFLVYALRFNFPRISSAFSCALKKQLCADLFDDSLNGKLVRAIRHVSGKPIYVAQTPLPARDEIKIASDTLTSYESLSAMMSDAVSAEKASLIRQPATTMDRDNYTLNKFSIGSMRLATSAAMEGAPHREKDVAHMNVDFGTIWLTAFFSLLEGNSSIST